MTNRPVRDCGSHAIDGADSAASFVWFLHDFCRTFFQISDEILHDSFFCVEQSQAEVETRGELGKGIWKRRERDKWAERGLGRGVTEEKGER